MAENKTKPTDASVDDYLTSKASDQQLSDLDQSVLEELVIHSVMELERRSR